MKDTWSPNYKLIFHEFIVTKFASVVKTLYFDEKNTNLPWLTIYCCSVLSQESFTVFNVGTKNFVSILALKMWHQKMFLATIVKTELSKSQSEKIFGYFSKCLLKLNFCDAYRRQTANVSVMEKELPQMKENYYNVYRC